MINKFESDSSNSGFIAQVPLDQHPFFTQIKEVQSEGFNQLYTAERFGKKWLLKGLKEEFRQQRLYIELLKKELDILMSLSYPYIVQAFGLEQIPNLGPCIVMEYVDGQTLTDLLQKGMTLRQKLKVVDQLLEALQYVHEKQIVHRDLKPANILITHNGGNVKLIDFGLADTDAYRILKQPAGTMRYMSPEQQAGNQPDIRNDIYSLGRLLEDLQLGRRYAKVIRRCLLPLSQRYADTHQLAAALLQIRQNRHRTVTLGFVAVFVLFLGYLTFQIRDIRNNMPEAQTSISLNTNWKEKSAAPQPTMVQSVPKSSDTLARIEEKKTVKPAAAIGDADVQKLDWVVQQGCEAIDRYMATTDMQQHIDTLTSIFYLDYQMYSEVAREASERLEAYIQRIKGEFSDRDVRTIHDALGNHLSHLYLEKWNAKTERLMRQIKP